METMMLPKKHLSKSMGLLLTVAVLGGCGDAADEPRPATPPPTTGAPGAAAPAAPAPTMATGDLPAGVTAEMVQQGQQVYAGAGICFTCHGQNAQGTPLGPALNDGEWIWIDTAQDVLPQLVTVIRTGVTSPREYPAPMPPMGGANLNEDQLMAVSAYLLTLN
jgi:mono/diheme cytochrome c family protein